MISIIFSSVTILRTDSQDSVAVSYTHLDVYKRQTLDYVESYQSTAGLALFRRGESYGAAVEQLAESAVDPEYGHYIRTVLNLSLIHI